MYILPNLNSKKVLNVWTAETQCFGYRNEVVLANISGNIKYSSLIQIDVIKIIPIFNSENLLTKL